MGCGTSQSAGNSSSSLSAREPLSKSKSKSASIQPSAEPADEEHKPVSGNEERSSIASSSMSGLVHNFHTGKKVSMARVPPSQRLNIFNGDDSFLTGIVPFKPQSMHLLVCDDDRSSVVLMNWLQASNYHVTRCVDGSEAVAVLEQAKRESGYVTDIHAILVDTEMQTERGKKVLDYVKEDEKTSHLPVILMSSDATLQGIDRCIRRGGSDFLMKPITKHVLLKTIRLICEKSVDVTNSALIKRQGDKFKSQITQHPVFNQLGAKGRPLISPAPMRVGQNKRHSWGHGSTGNTLLGSTSHSPSTGGGGSRLMYPTIEETVKVTHAKVVVVDSDVSVLEVTDNWLSMLGTIECICVETCAEAYGIIESSMADMHPVDLAIVDAGEVDDVTGKPSKSGVRLLDRMMSNPVTAGVPVLLMGTVTPEEMTQAVRHGSETCIPKPLSRDFFVRKATSVLESIAQKKFANSLYNRAQKYSKLLEMMRNGEAPEGKAVCATPGGTKVDVGVAAGRLRVVSSPKPVKLAQQALLPGQSLQLDESKRPPSLSPSPIPSGGPDSPVKTNLSLSVEAFDSPPGNSIRTQPVKSMQSPSGEDKAL
jgi:CheY-like chemotaxis protein